MSLSNNDDRGRREPRAWTRMPCSPCPRATSRASPRHEDSAAPRTAAWRDEETGARRATEPRLRASGYRRRDVGRLARPASTDEAPWAPRPPSPNPAAGPLRLPPSRGIDPGRPWEPQSSTPPATHRRHLRCGGRCGVSGPDPGASTQTIEPKPPARRLDEATAVATGTRTPIPCALLSHMSIGDESTASNWMRPWKPRARMRAA